MWRDVDIAARTINLLVGRVAVVLGKLAERRRRGGGRLGGEAHGAVADFYVASCNLDKESKDDGPKGASGPSGGSGPKIIVNVVKAGPRTRRKSADLRGPSLLSFLWAISAYRIRRGSFVVALSSHRLQL